MLLILFYKIKRKKMQFFDSQTVMRKIGITISELRNVVEHFARKIIAIYQPNKMIEDFRYSFTELGWYDFKIDLEIGKKIEEGFSCQILIQLDFLDLTDPDYLEEIIHDHYMDEMRRKMKEMKRKKYQKRRRKNIQKMMEILDE
jgi:hypothetical protein